ncbi:MAG: HNH endonuclease [Gammaproteobacteria bacterium]|nr:HNH endonuclease [Gammaproteobacteria bacterium]
MAATNNWTRQQLLVAFALYCQMPYGKMHSRNPEIIKIAEQIGRTPSALAMKLTNIASLDPEITSTGRTGLRGASSADKSMWDEMQGDWEGFAVKSGEAMRVALQGTEIPSLEIDEEEIDYSGKDKVVITTARDGQRFFRNSVLSAYDFKCCISGLANPRLLVASHIVPWRNEVSNRLNPANGLSLSVLHDKAFDIGLITINEDMTVRVSKKSLDELDYFYRDTILSYEGKPISLPEKFFPKLEFLAYHRAEVFEKPRRSR